MNEFFVTSHFKNILLLDGLNAFFFFFSDLDTPMDWGKHEKLSFFWHSIFNERNSQISFLFRKKKTIRKFEENLINTKYDMQERE